MKSRRRILDPHTDQHWSLSRRWCQGNRVALSPGSLRFHTTSTHCGRGARKDDAAQQRDPRGTGLM
jgi:hypothetical protein